MARTKWQQRAQAPLPPEKDVIARNAAITATYANWYRTHPQLLKWAGAAAFASYRVGFALLPYQFTVVDGIITDISEVFDRRRDKRTVMGDLDLIRQTNNFVFRDIGWAHLAYISNDGGMAAVDAGLSDTPDHQLMLDGFREIEQGRKLLAEQPADDHAAQVQIWHGNYLLLKHEQTVTVQGQFAKLDPGFRTFLSLATSLDFDANNLEIDWSTSTSFELFMWTRGLPMLARTCALPNIADVRQRWFWVEHSVLPIWKRVATSDPKLAQKIALLMRGLPRT